MMSTTTRRARPEDAEAAVLVLRRSISELCVADHDNDPLELADWLANKTDKGFRSWLEAPDSAIFVAVREDKIVAVGGCRADGEITLNYVSPDARFKGVSSLLLDRLESHLRGLGIYSANLTSTRTAHDFYRSRGYVDCDDSERRMRKKL